MALPTTSDTSTLSPREQFEKSVRQLNSNGVYKHRRNKSINLRYNPYELQHVSSLRVSPVRKDHYRADLSSLRNVVEERDFGSEERDVWSQKSPVNRKQESRSSSFAIHEDVTASPSQYRGTSHLPSLKPQIIVTGSEERPKTRHGPKGHSAFDTFAEVERVSTNGTDTQSMRQPKFAEGTMTSRSGPVSSSWSGSEYATSSSEAEESDSDATPKVRKRRSGSIDLREFQPPQSTPSATRRTLFGRRDQKKDKVTDKSSKPKQTEDGEEKKPKKRLRKSMSKLQFLGEKMKIFGSSSHDLHHQTKMNAAFQDEKSVLDERKRKAEAAYAEQFGLKKQRDNDGSANVTSSSEVEDVPEPKGNQKYDSSTVRYRATTTRSRRISTGSIYSEQSMNRQDSINEHDIRKRPSRRELEKENQQLRAMLRESQAAVDQTTVYNSEPESIPPVPPLRIRRSYAAPTQVQAEDADSSITSKGVFEAPPPLPPQNPNRRALGVVSNNRSRRSRRESFGVVSDADLNAQNNDNVTQHVVQGSDDTEPTILEKPAPIAPRRSISGMSRSVSMIVEEPEDDTEGKKRSLRLRRAVVGKENTLAATTVGTVERKEEWQWPDDVF